jgi:hypothetical protein
LSPQTRYADLDLQSGTGDEMTLEENSKHSERWRWILPAAIFAFSILLYLITLPKSILPGDSGELIAASQTMNSVVIPVMTNSAERNPASG